MTKEWILFISTFATLLAIINPFEALPVFLLLLEGKDLAEHRKVAARSSLYATLLLLFFLFFGSLILRVFGVPLSMVRIVGGIILTKIGFDLFSGTRGRGSMVPAGGADEERQHRLRAARLADHVRSGRHRHGSWHDDAG